MAKPIFSRHPLTGEPIVPIGHRQDGRAIWPIMGGDENTDPAGGDGGDPVDAGDFAALDQLLTFGDKTFEVKELQRMMAAEKRQGKRSGTTELLSRLGYDTVEELEAALSAGTTPKVDPQTNDDDAVKAALDAVKAKEKAADERSAVAASKARTSDLKGALAALGAKRGSDEYNDALALLDRAVPSEYDDDELDEAAEKLAERRPELFGGEKKPETTPPPRGGGLPGGRPGSRPAPTPAVFGAAGKARAERMFGKKS